MSNRSHSLIAQLLASAVSLVAIMAPAYAEDERQQGQDQDIIVIGEAEAGYKVSTTTSAMRTSTPLIDTPQSVSVVTSKQIEDQMANSVGDAVRYTPGIYSAQGEGNRETLVIRGMTTTGDFFVDGIRDDVQTYRDLYNIQRLEVFRGSNAMTFGRGGTGGLINRVTKVAGWNPVREVRLEGGMYEHFRGTIDLGGPVNDAIAVRIVGVVQDSGSYRHGVNYNRWGFNPTVSLKLGERTIVQIGYEHFQDDRVADRGVPSQLRAANGPAAEPLATPRGQFFGDPLESPTWTNTDAANLYIAHELADGISIRNRTRYASYDKFYQNIFTTGLNGSTLTNTSTVTGAPGLPIGSYAPGTVAGIQGYNTLTNRENLINQTDLNAEFTTGTIKHTMLVGAEFGRQKTDNLGQNAVFPTTGTATVTAIYVPVANPLVSRSDVRWLSNPSSNFGTLTVAAGYIQDQIEIMPQLQVILGARYEHLKTEVTNRQAGDVFTQKTDDLWSPRAGLVFKPLENASIYASFSRSYLPRGGDQLTSLAPNNRNLAPERYSNYEIGAKWDINPNFNLSAAVYQLDRDNVIVLIDPNDAGKGTELGGGQRSRGFEVAIAGQLTPQLSLVGSYTFQEAEFVRAISATVNNGSQIPNAPRHSGSLWGRYDVTPKLGIALGGTFQGRRFAAQDNLVKLPRYARLDGALFYKLSDDIDLQVNVENLTGERYFVFAHSNTNITPGAPTTVRGALNVKF